MAVTTSNFEWENAPPGTYLDSLVLYFTTCALRQSDAYAPLHTRALKLAAMGGATVSPILSPLVNHIIILHTPVSASTIPAIRRAESDGVIIASLEWLENCVLEQSLLETTGFPVATWAVAESEAVREAPSQPAITSAVFRGLRCAVGPLALRDPDGCAAVTQQILSGRGKMLAHNGSGFVTSGVPTHVVCAGSLRRAERAVLEACQSTNERLVVVTPFWIESCAQARKLLRVSDCVLFSPVECEVPVRGMVEGKISVTISGFQRRPPHADLNRRREVLSEIITLLGGTYSEQLRRRKTTVVVAEVVGGVESDKVVKAREWGIEVVGFEWVVACAREGKVADMNRYRIATSAEDVLHTPSQPKRKMSGVYAKRKSPRLNRAKSEDIVDPATTIKLFQRFAAGLNEESGSGMGASQFVMQNASLEADDSLEEVRRSGRRGSRSASRDGVEAEERDRGREWSMDASQSQVIVHRDLTPPSTPILRKTDGVRNMPNRAAKGSRNG